MCTLHIALPTSTSKLGYFNLQPLSSLLGNKRKGRKGRKEKEREGKEKEGKKRTDERGREGKLQNEISGVGWHLNSVRCHFASSSKCFDCPLLHPFNLCKLFCKRPPPVLSSRTDWWSQLAQSRTWLLPLSSIYPALNETWIKRLQELH